MQNKVKHFLNFILENFGMDNSIIGLCGLKKKTTSIQVVIPKEYKQTFIQNIEKNYLLL